MLIAHRHARLIMIKRTAYAWRQTIFYLSMLGSNRRDSAILQIEAHFRDQPLAFRIRFDPVMRGLRLAAEGQELTQNGQSTDGARVLWGWTKSKHWLLV